MPHVVLLYRPNLLCADAVGTWLCSLSCRTTPVSQPSCEEPVSLFGHGERTSRRQGASVVLDALPEDFLTPTTLQGIMPVVSSTLLSLGLEVTACMHIPYQLAAWCFAEMACRLF